jgi:hypothetical protein
MSYQSNGNSVKEAKSILGQTNNESLIDSRNADNFLQACSG